MPRPFRHNPFQFQPESNIAKPYDPRIKEKKINDPYAGGTRKAPEGKFELHVYEARGHRKGWGAGYSG